MAVCDNCVAELDPRWKFCVYCGSPAPVPETIPAAIRADRQDPGTARRLPRWAIPASLLGAVVLAGLAYAILGGGSGA